MTLQLTNQILMAERDVRPARDDVDGRFTPERTTTRERGARLIRATAHQSLRLANRLDPGYRYA